jgi:hypothetical protein
MTTWVKIDRATGKDLKYKKADSLKRDFSKKYVWIEFQEGAQPIYNPETQKIVKAVTQPDLSNLSIDVDPTAKRIEGWTIVALDTAELEIIKNNKIARTDNGLIRALEDILALIAQGKPLNKNNLPASAIDKVNERRSYRGGLPV